MASPPYQGANSPPGSSPLALPKQRAPTLALPSKSRKPSNLRQTSFPPPDSLEAQHQLAEDQTLRQTYSPGATSDGLEDFSDSEITSAISGPVGDGFSPKKRKRGDKKPIGRPPKNPRRTGRESVSLINGEDSGRRRRTPTGAPSVLTGEGDEEDDDEDDDGGLGARGDGFTLDPAELERDNQRRYLFREAVPPQHQARYDTYNRVKLRTADVRRLVNATLSQSVPANVVTVVGAYTKMFAGMLIEQAKEVQAEWTAASPMRADGGEQAAYKRLKLMQPQNEDEEYGRGNVKTEPDKEDDTKAPEEKAILPDGDPDSEEENDTKPAAIGESQPNGVPKNTQSTIPNGSQDASRPSSSKESNDKTSDTKPEDDLPNDFAHVQPGAWGLSKYVEECDRGPIMPDHLREALRRYRKSRGGGSVGYTGISLFGVEGRDVAAPKMGGRRLFR